MTTYEKQVDSFKKKTGLKIVKKFVKNGLHFQDDRESRDIYQITFNRKSGKVITSNFKQAKPFSFRFGQSINDSNGCTPPTDYDILASITKYDPNTFEDFCMEFGYDTDSRAAEKIYNDVKDEWKKVSSFFTESELELLREIN